MSELPRTASRVCAVMVGLVFLHNALPHLTTLPRVNVDEPWLMERGFELLRSGEPRQPMYGLDGAYLLQPGYSYLLAPWFGLFGVGVWQARLLGVILGVGILAALWGVGRLLGGTGVAAVATLLIASDSNFLGGVRNARTDIPALFFVTLALWLFLRGRHARHVWWHVASGLATGAAMLCHANSYWVALILLTWYLVDHAKRWWKVPAGYAYSLGVLAALAPYLAVIAIYWDEFQRQLAVFAGDRVPGTNASFVWQQVLREPERYRGWYFGLVTNDVPNPLLWTFQVLVVAGVVSGFVALAQGARGARASRAKMVLLAVGAAVIFAGFINNKALVYMPHLLIGFALVAAAFVSDASEWLARAWRRTQRPAASAVVLFVVLYGATSVAYYQRWYQSALRSELVPFESTEATLQALVPAGPKLLIASPHFWVPYAGADRVAFHSYANVLPDENGGLPAAHGRPTYLLVDETQWVTDMLPGARETTELWRSRWTRALSSHCALQAVALGTAYGTMALFECGADVVAPSRVRVVGGTTEYVAGHAVVDAGPDALAGWPHYADPRRDLASPPPALQVTAEGVAFSGGGWPGLERYVEVTPGARYLVTYDVASARPGDLLYIGRWEREEVRSLSGASASGIAAPLALPEWFPDLRAFHAVADQVRVLVYSEAPETTLVVRRLTIRRLERAGS
jgi:4-amino-4-deoxy-L-arabinose transferase-like glycosyltransferase